MSSSRLINGVVVCAVVLQAVSASALVQPGTVLSQRKISTTDGGFKGILSDGDFFGDCVVSLGDLDGDGVTELAVGADGDDVV